MVNRGPIVVRRVTITGSTFSSARRSMDEAASFCLCRVSSCTYDLPEYEVSYLEVSMSDPGVVLSGHAILVSSDPLLRRRPNLVYQVQL